MHAAMLCCPKDRTRLTYRSDATMSCERGHSYPVVDDVPVLLRDDVEQTMDLAVASLARAKGEPFAVDMRNADLYLESLGVSEAEKQIAVEQASRGTRVDPVVSVIVGATNGIAYKHLIGTAFEYPIPDIRLPAANGRLLLDVGCNWGRWSIAAARRGYRVVGVDPSLGAIMAARRVARQLNLAIDYICADARYLPFADCSFDMVFSYSVIQHFSKIDAVIAFEDVGRVLKPAGDCLIQMPNRSGMRSLVHLFRRGFAEGSGFDVRYWSIRELQREIERCIGPSNVSVHCYFGLGLEPADLHLMPRHLQWAVAISESIRRMSSWAPWLVQVADSVYVSATKRHD